MDLDGQKVLVIGGAGFIGSHVVDELLATRVREVVIYDNFTRGVRDNLKGALLDSRCTIYPNGGDIRDLDLLDDAMRGVDCVIHLAAMWLMHCQDYPRTAFEVNVGGTFNVLEASVRHSVRRLVFSSSASVYGDAVQLPMGESHPLNNRNFYGATKISGEAMCKAFYESHGLPYVGLRYMNVYGPRQDQYSAYTGVIPKLLNAIDQNLHPEINGDGSQSYDFVYVKDVAKANILALQSNEIDAFYNIGTGVQTSISNLVQETLRLTSSRLKPVYIPYSDKDARQFVRKRVGAVDLAKNKLGFSAETSLLDGLMKLMSWREAVGMTR